VLSVDFFDGADVPASVLNEKAGAPVPPVTAAAASFFSLEATPNENAGALAAAADASCSICAVDEAPNEKTATPSLSSSPNDRGEEGMAAVAVLAAAESASPAPDLFVAGVAAAAAAPRLNLLGNGIFGGVVSSCRDEGVDGSIFLGGGVPTTANPDPSPAAAAAASVRSNLPRFATPPPPGVPFARFSFSLPRFIARHNRSSARAVVHKSPSSRPRLGVRFPPRRTVDNDEEDRAVVIVVVSRERRCRLRRDAAPSRSPRRLRALLPTLPTLTDDCPVAGTYVRAALSLVLAGGLSPP
jgi:hypothetical protein